MYCYAVELLVYTCRHDFTGSPFSSIGLLIISRFVKYSNIAFSFSGSVFHIEIFHSKITYTLGSLEKLGDFCRYISLSDCSALFLGLYSFSWAPRAVGSGRVPWRLASPTNFTCNRCQQQKTSKLQRTTYHPAITHFCPVSVQCHNKTSQPTHP